MFVAVLATGCAQVLLFRSNDSRLQIGKQLGAFPIFNYHQLKPNLREIVRSHTEG
ncbi:MAG TPA: hypothetical protein V6D27_00420 [Vampirovibrionales bacterium]